MRAMRAIRTVAKVPVPIREILSQSAGPAPDEIAALMSAVERFPDHVLFHLDEEVEDRLSTHPNSSRRLLYLWRNRDEFATV